ncbi:RidA family protein [Priestia taiwanensis]|uniref:RidA family protein n=1 Tax=Priestia taiwanensis TaxID=1347902 RepID=A0A917AJ53_9BACI|nr:RidA family protein [Priestia taiwanensis]GGE55690.1 hypothetical protein GCM10007140_02560 [Priestia taiwanensis]
MKRTHVYTGSPWESIVGYSRAIRVGNTIAVAGTTAMKDGKIVGINDPYEQTKFILQTITYALEEVDANLSHVIRTRMYVTDISNWEAIGKAHGEFFQHIQPVATMVEVQALIDPDLLVEIEVDAIVP